MSLFESRFCFARRIGGVKGNRASHLWSGTALRCVVILAVTAGVGLLAPGARIALAQTSDAQDRTQPRESKVRVPVPAEKIKVDDGDTVDILWTEDDIETIRILGIDTPETQHLPHNLPYEQPFGEVAKGFARGVFSLADEVELLRADMMDPYGRTLGYLFVNGKNYSVLVVAAGLAAESVSFYGDNGLPEPAQAVLEAARQAPPLAFEPPHQYRKRMRELTDWMKAHGEYPTVDDENN